MTLTFILPLPLASSLRYTILTYPIDPSLQECRHAPPPVLPVRVLRCGRRDRVLPHVRRDADGVGPAAEAHQLRQRRGADPQGELLRLPRRQEEVRQIRHDELREAAGRRGERRTDRTRQTG